MAVVFATSARAGAAKLRLDVANPVPLTLSIAGVAGEQAVLEWSADLRTWESDQTNYLDGVIAPLRVRPLNQPSPLAFYRARRLELPEDSEPSSCYDETEPSNTHCPVYGLPDIPTNRTKSIPNPTTPVKLVRLFIHVLADDNGDNPAASLPAVEAQMATLNELYLPSRIQFLAEWQVAPSAQFRVLDPKTEALPMKQAFAREPDRFHNVYVTEMPLNVRGFSTLPWDVNATNEAGGTVVNSLRFGEGEPTLAHELGHALGLWHTHHGTSDEVSACSACWEGVGIANPDEVGDRCSDTPVVPLDANGAPLSLTDVCPPHLEWPASTRYNLMSGAPQFGGGFTSQQAGRMHAWITERLQGWLDLETPAAPSSLAGAANPFGEIHLTWAGNSWNETAFRVEWSGADGAFEPIAMLGANATSYTDLEPNPGATNYYRIVAVNGALAANGSAVISMSAGPRPSELYVDHRATSVPDGSEAHPFPTVAEATQATDGPAVIHIEAGEYPENLTLEGKVLRLEAKNGRALIGRSR